MDKDRRVETQASLKGTDDPYLKSQMEVDTMHADDIKPKSRNENNKIFSVMHSELIIFLQVFMREKKCRIFFSKVIKLLL